MLKFTFMQMGASAQPLAMHIGSASAPRYFYLHDRLDSVRQLLNESGLPVNNYTYNPFGEDIASECSETVDNPWKYTGQWHDKETGQYYLRARQYDPHIARFTTRDPITGGFREPRTLHAYLYCVNDPINLIDPDGRFAIQLLKENIYTKSMLRSARRLQAISEMRNSTMTSLDVVTQISDALATYYSDTRFGRNAYMNTMMALFTDRAWWSYKDVRGPDEYVRFEDAGNNGLNPSYGTGQGQMRHLIGFVGVAYFYGKLAGHYALEGNEWGNDNFGDEDWRLGWRGIELGLNISSGHIDNNLNWVSPMKLKDVGNWMRNELGSGR